MDHSESRDDTVSYQLPQTIGGYRIERQIGCGGMSNVFSARKSDNEEPVALKVLDARFGAESAMRQRFQREVQAIQSLTHDHIVPLYGYGDDQGTPFLAMRLIDGVTLSMLIQYLREESDHIDKSVDTLQWADLTTQADLPKDANALAAACFAAARTHDSIFQDIAELVAYAADAIDEAHRHGIVHRDIKPSNLMIDRDGRLWLTDFGLASVEEVHTVVTKSGEMIGTPHYMSPEQATADRKSIDHRTDIYSLGATLYELATLKRPYQGDRFRVLMEISTGRLAAPSQICPNIPKPLEAIILKAMQYAPADRYASGAAMADDLRRFARGKTVAAKQPRFSDHIVRWIVRNPRLSIGSVAAVTAIGLLIMMIMYGNSQRLEKLNSQLRELNQFLDKTNVEIARANAATEQSRAQLRRHLYIADVAAAYQAYDNRDLDDVQQMLSRHITESDGALLEEDEDLRGYEWYLLNNLCQPPESREIGRHDAAAREIVLLPGQQTCLTTGDDGTVRRWSLLDGLLGEPYTIGARIDALATTADGTLFVAAQNIANKNNRLSVQRVDTGEIVQELQGHTNSIESIAISPDGKLVASADRYNELALHRIDGELISRRQSGSRNESLAFSPDGKYVACIVRDKNRDQSLQLLSTPDLEIVHDWKFDFDPNVFAFSGDGRRILVSSPEDFALCSWPDGKKRVLQHDLRDRIRCVALNRSGSTVYAGCDNGMLYVWKFSKSQLSGTASEPELMPRMIPTGTSMITRIAVTDKDEAILTTESGSVQFWQTNRDPNTPRSLKEIAPNVAAAKPTSTDLVVRLLRGTVARLNLADCRLEPLQQVPADDSLAVAVSGDGQFIVASAPNALFVLSGSDGQLLTRIDQPAAGDSTTSLAFTRDGKRLLHLLNDRFQVYSVGPLAADWSLIKEVPFKSDSSRDIAPSPADDRIIVLTSELLIFDSNRYKPLQAIPCAFGDFTSMHFSDDGELLMLGCRDGTIEVRQTSDFERISILRGHRSSIRSCILIDHNQTMISGTTSEIRFWDLASGRYLGFLPMNGSLNHLRYCPQTESLFTFFNHEKVLAWSARN